jgi:predicted Zn-dependent peptidase
MKMWPGWREVGQVSSARGHAALVLVLVLALAACGGEAAHRPAPRVRPFAALAAAAAEAAPPADPLGPKPEPGEPAAYTPPTPARWQRANGMEVWLLERRGLPIVSMQLVVSAGASHDPEGKGGLAATTADMLDEGAGKRGPLELSRDVDRLGATLRTGVYADYAFARLTVLKKNLAPAAEIFADVVTRPRMSPVEYKRIHELWTNALRARQSEPDAVAGVVLARKAYPAAHPYAHPQDGTLASAAKVTLADVKRFYAEGWRPDRATLVVVGDVSRADLDAVLEETFAGWKAPKSPPLPAPAAAPASEQATRRVFVVDRADAPQSVIAVARPGVAASDPDAAVVGRVNAALGGTFTSRLNQDLRETHGWTYGAYSRFSWTRLTGLFVAQAAVQTEHTGEALKAMLADVQGMAKGGLTHAEVEASRKHARSSLVEAFETVEGAAARIARSAGTGLPPEREAQAAQAAQRADEGRLDEVAAKHLDVGAATVVIVGPRKQIEPQLAAIGVTSIETTGPEGE